MIQELLERMQKEWPALSSDQTTRIGRFYQLLLEENEKQNLTRLTSPQDFVEGHVLDVKVLLESRSVDFPAMDLGSGAGVPGLLAAIVQPDQWVLAESERNKAEFLFRIVREFGLSGVRVVADRGESYLAENQVKSVVARAVGPVERIFAWLAPCSTWNTLVLLKGPAWSTEWEAFQKSRYRNDLLIESTHDYTIGAEAKRRVIVRLKRVNRHVPRGT